MNIPSATLESIPTFLSPADLQARWAIGRTMTYETLVRTDFPRPLHFGKAKRFLLSDVMAWERAQTKAPQLPAKARRGPKAA